MPEGKLFKLVAQTLHAHSAGQGSIDVKRLFGDARALLGRDVLERAHIVQAIRKLDEKHTYVVGDGQQELAKIFRLLSALGDQIELLDLGKTIDQPADL